MIAILITHNLIKAVKHRNCIYSISLNIYCCLVFIEAKLLQLPISLLVYSLVQSSLLSTTQNTVLIVHSYYLYITTVLHTYLAYIRLSIVQYYLHRIYKIFSLSLSYFIFLTWYQSYCSDILVPVIIFSALLLPSPSSSSYCQKQVTVVTSIVPATLESHHFVHQTAKAKAQHDKIANLEQNPTKNSQKGPNTHPHTLPKAFDCQTHATSSSHVLHALVTAPTHTSTRLSLSASLHVSPRVTSSCTRQHLASSTHVSR